jgi:hypothetical protein
MRAFLLAWTWLLPIAAAGCANYATLQDAETLPKGKAQMGVGLTLNRYPLELETTETTSNGGEVTRVEHEEFTVPAFVLGVRYGLR